MSQAGATTTGLKETRDELRALPAAVTARLRAVANRSGQRVLARARENLRRQTKGTGALADAIFVFEDVAAKQVRVNSMAPQNRIKNGKLIEPPLNVPIWVEFGTQHMAARPYLGPALFDEQDAYLRESEAAAVGAVKEIFG